MSPFTGSLVSILPATGGEGCRAETSPTKRPSRIALIPSAPIVGDVVGIALAVLSLIARIVGPPLPVAVTACLPVLRIGAVLPAVIVGAPAPLTVG